MHEKPTQQTISLDVLKATIDTVVFDRPLPPGLVFDLNEFNNGIDIGAVHPEGAIVVRWYWLIVAFVSGGVASLLTLASVIGHVWGAE